MKALLAVNKTALAAEQRDAQSAEPRQRMTFGVYFYTEPMPAVIAHAVPSDDVQNDPAA
ncbi:MAG: hypothetical protein FD135_1022 [Comamonadaceae bacterium]|nr:MAG: hypothetical protein FD135_1022 [Comamonadaceae bacterium]